MNQMSIEEIVEDLETNYSDNIDSWVMDEIREYARKFINFTPEETTLILSWYEKLKDENDDLLSLTDVQLYNEITNEEENLEDGLQIKKSKLMHFYQWYYALLSLDSRFFDSLNQEVFNNTLNKIKNNMVAEEDIDDEDEDEDEDDSEENEQTESN